MKNVLQIFTAAIIVYLLIGTGVSSAFMIDLDVPNRSALNGLNFATVKGTLSGDAKTMSFSVMVDPGLYPALGGSGPMPSNFGMDAFFFTTDLVTRDGKGRITGLDPNLSLVGSDPSGWRIKKLGKNVSKFGTFAIGLKNSGRHHRNSTAHLLGFDAVWNGPGTLSDSNFLIPLNGSTDGSNIFATHIRFGCKIKQANDGIGSIFATNGPGDDSRVPEPGTMVLLGISLITVAGYIRRISGNIG